MTDRYCDKPHEECGVYGIYSQDGADVVSAVYDGLFALQHRGQESCGIVVNDDGVMVSFKDTGLVGDVFTESVLSSLGQGQIAIGHVRYGTTGEMSRKNAQPLVINHVKGMMALAHNGNLTNAGALRLELENAGSIFHTTSDTEVIAYIITRHRLTEPSIERAVAASMKELAGAYSLVLMSPRKLIAARDPLGFKPLCLGKREGTYIVASESCALSAYGAEFVRDVEPGEVLVIDERGVTSLRDNCTEEKKALCVFEYIYFARPDSVIDGSSVHMARRRAGALLAVEHHVDADVVVGVPDSGLDAAMGYAQQSGIPYGLGFIKNKYIGRTFIEPGRKKRESGVRIKLTAMSATVAGKRVIMIDDSIVRGTTSAHIVQLLRDAGATEVHIRISSPPFLFPCYFGTDIDSSDKLIAHKHSIEEIREMVGADSLGFLSVEDVHKLAYKTHIDVCDACFTGDYPVEPPADCGKCKFERKLSEKGGAV